MVAFCIGSEEKIDDSVEDFIKELIGLKEIRKRQENLWILVFEDEESAINAQILLDLNGANGIRN